MSLRVLAGLLLASAGSCLAGRSRILTLPDPIFPGWRVYSLLADDQGNAASKTSASTKSRQIFAPTDFGFDPNSALLLNLLNKRECRGASWPVGGRFDFNGVTIFLAGSGGGFDGSGYGGYGFGGPGYGGYGSGYLPWMNPLAFPASFSNYGYATQPSVYQGMTNSH